MDSGADMLPMDENNRTLIDNVHPGGWINPEPAGRYNLVVIGAGTAGLVAAAGAAGLGARVALVERHLMGGDCLNFGCVPSKGVIRAARAIHDCRTSQAFGIAGGERLSIDFASVMTRMRRIRSEISRHDSAERFRDELGVDVFFGTGSFTAPDAIEVEGKQLRFKRAAVCTGRSPRSISPAGSDQPAPGGCRSSRIRLAAGSRTRMTAPIVYVGWNVRTIRRFQRAGRR